MVRVLLIIPFAFFACKKDSEPAPVQYTVSGKVIDTLGAGIEFIKVYYKGTSSVSTDATGSWQTGLIQGKTTIEPQDPAYQFTPATVEVTGSASDLVFTAHRVYPPTVASYVYQWFTREQLANGLLESTEGSNFVSLYDNALAAMVFIAKKDYARAEKIFDFFNGRVDGELLSGTGGFSQFRNANGVPTGGRWLGDNAWMLIALNNYAAKTGSNKYSRLSSSLAGWIRNLQDVDGGIWQGYDGSGAKTGKITENMIDAFNAISGYDAFHVNLLNYFKTYRWEPIQKLLVSWPGSPYAYAMDNFSWGYCTFEDFPNSVLQKADMFLSNRTSTITSVPVNGYCFDTDRDVVWLEGTGQMAVAFNKAGQTDKASYYLGEIEKVMKVSGAFAPARGFPYAANFGSGYGSDPLWTGVDTNICISSGAWYLFGVWRFDPMSAGYVKNIPVGDKFWL